MNKSILCLSDILFDQKIEIYNFQTKQLFICDITIKENIQKLILDCLVINFVKKISDLTQPMTNITFEIRNNILTTNISQNELSHKYRYVRPLQKRPIQENKIHF